MLDLETLGNKPGSVIGAIGAVTFGDGKIISEFYQRVDAQSCIDAGLKMDVSTVMWWLAQGGEARAEMVKEGFALQEILRWFSQRLAEASPDPEDVVLWGNGAAFDNVLLAAAYDACRRDRPWKCWNDRCYRTVKALFPAVPFQRVGTHHNALDDARSQAMHLMAIRQHAEG